jgi:arginine decarboxylase
VCDAAGVAHPEIISESGRALAAYSSVLVFNTLGSASFEHHEAVETAGQADDLPRPLADLLDAYTGLDPDRAVEVYHDAEHAYDQAIQMFSVGALSLEQRALAERLFWSVCTRVREQHQDPETLPAALETLPAMLSDIYFCNVSVFQSLPDSWAIGQLFPIMPIHRLSEAPQRPATLADITCDSDGKLDRFVGPGGPTTTLPLHALHAGANYYVAAFLIGAYQETLGDLHNLFGDTHVVTIRAEDDGSWIIDEVVEGDAASELLSYMQFDTDDLKPMIWRDCERAVRSGAMTLEESQVLRRFYENELESYSYLDLPA